MVIASTLLAGIAVCLALSFDFTNGFNDSANQVATIISSRALSPPKALTLAAVGNFVGSYFLGTAVAETIGKGIVDPRIIRDGNSGVYVVIAALVGATLWNLVTWYLALPSSSSHALIGGLIGAFVISLGPAALHWKKVLSIVVVMVVSPLIGFVMTFIAARLVLNACQYVPPRAGQTFDRLQVITLVTQAVSHGTNDAQKTMGVITFVLVVLGLQQAPATGPLIIRSWVVLACSSVIALGTMIGGWRIIKTLGTGFYRVNTVQAFVSQAAASLIIYMTAVLGYPISTTQVISSGVIGAGAATRFNKVRWGLAQEMGVAWLATIPASALMAGSVSYALRGFGFLAG